MVDSSVLGGFVEIVPVVRTLFVIIFAYAAFSLVLGTIERTLLKKVKTKKQITNVEIFSNIFRYSFLLLLILLAVFSYGGSFAGLGLTMGLLSAALGWALQKPITGIAAWIMVVIKRPFDIGDRVIIGNVKGEVCDISLTHIYIKEVGGLVQSEEISGRTVMVPNSVLFEQNIINYTYKYDFTLDQVAVSVTYESDLNKAIEIALAAAKKYTKDYALKAKEPFVRTYFQPNGINVHVRYFSPVRKIQEVSSSITQEIFAQISKSKHVHFAYPHTEVILRKPIQNKGGK